MMSGNALKAVLFDLDGTLLDTAPDFALVLEKMCTEQDLPPIPYERVRGTVSNGARALVQMAFGLQPGENGFDDQLQRLLSLYNRHLGDKTVPFDGIPELLLELAEWNIPWGVVTNKPEWLAAPLLERINLSPACSVLICPDHVLQRKPHPEPMHLACSRLAVDAGNVVYVGDHLRDIQAGNAAGMATIAAAWGYLDESENPADWNADFVAATVTDTVNLLRTVFC